MNDNVLDALAKGMVPHVQRCVAAALGPLTERIAELEARPREKGEAGAPGEAGPPGPPGPPGSQGDGGSTLLPGELAEEVARAVRLLHESPPIEQRDAPRPSAPKVTRIERDDDGNFVPIYAETKS